MIKRINRAFAVLLVCMFVGSSYIAWSGFTGREPIPIPDALGGGGAGTVSGTDSNFSDLNVKQGDAGDFAGTISINNPSTTYQDVLVTVDLFQGDQNVGELIGSVTVKPGTSSSVELMSVDTYVSWTDARVDLLRS
jgi:hypothetical protein